MVARGGSASSSDVLDFLPERTILFEQVEGDLDGDGDNDVVFNHQRDDAQCHS